MGLWTDFRDGVTGAGKGVVNTFAAPLNLVADVFKGKNVIESWGARITQNQFSMGGGTTGQLFQTDPAKKTTKALSPYTLGFTGTVQGMNDRAFETSQGKSLSSKEQYLLARDAAIVQGVAFAGASAAGYGPVAGQAATTATAVKGAAPTVTTLAVGTKVLTGKGTASDLAALSGIDPTYLEPVSALNDLRKSQDPDGYVGAPPDFGGPDYAAASAPKPIPPAVIIGGLVLAVGLFSVMVRRRA